MLSEAVSCAKRKTPGRRRRNPARAAVSRFKRLSFPLNMIILVIYTTLGAYEFSHSYLLFILKKPTLFHMKDFAGADIARLFGKNLKRIRSNKKMSQLTLANMADLTHNFINEIENGRKWVSSDTIAKLAAILEAEPFQFFIPDQSMGNIDTQIFQEYIDEMSVSFGRMVQEFRAQYLRNLDNPNSAG
ncbi:MAG: helix-turn-helix domain-containing protein [Spirochaetaceae bacterium]|jgi:transcriptional regulator with XRE-family HTH domain|nr:helix-turn-helix domain-containing protein [Spirochaetaceae bacterium]